MWTNRILSKRASSLEAQELVDSRRFASAALLVAMGDGRAKLRRLNHNLSPDEVDTESDASGKENASMQCEIQVLKLELESMRAKLAQGKEELDQLRGEVEAMGSQLDFLRRVAVELTNSVGNFAAFMTTIASVADEPQCDAWKPEARPGF